MPCPPGGSVIDGDAGVSEKSCRLNVAVTEAGALTVTVQVLVPEQAPLQPLKVELASGFAVSCALEPLGNDAEHVGPQLIPDGLLMTVPLPFPAFATAKTITGLSTNVAVTVVSAERVTVQSRACAQPVALHPAKAEPGSGAAPRSSDVPAGKLAEQKAPQPICPTLGASPTVPVPLPDLLIVSV